MTDVTTLLAPFRERATVAAQAEVTFNGDSLDQDYIRALEASHEDVHRLLAALDAVIALADRADIAEESSFAGPKGSISEWERGFNDGKAEVADAIRAAVTAALGEQA